MAWLSDEEYRRVRETVPIVCVDVVTVRVTPDATVGEIGLILRDTPHQGRRWCLVGGRVRKDETLAEAAARHLHETLGPSIRFRLDPDPQPVYVSQYFTIRRPVGVIDPRQHSVAMNFVVPIEGEPVPAGEAYDFRWVSRSALPTSDEFGFEQDRVLRAVLERAGSVFSAAGGT